MNREKPAQDEQFHRFRRKPQQPCGKKEEEAWDKRTEALVHPTPAQQCPSCHPAEDLPALPLQHFANRGLGTNPGQTLPNCTESTALLSPTAPHGSVLLPVKKKLAAFSSGVASHAVSAWKHCTAVQEQQGLPVPSKKLIWELGMTPAQAKPSPAGQQPSGLKPCNQS